jgi:hypothetical protein
MGTRGPRLGVLGLLIALAVGSGLSARPAGAAPTISVMPTTASPGNTLTVTWSGLVSPTPNNWAGIYPEGAPDEQYFEWVWLGTCAQVTGPVAPSAGSCPLRIDPARPPGRYNVRIFNPPTATALVVSPVVLVAVPPPGLPGAPTITGRYVTSWTLTWSDTAPSTETFEIERRLNPGTYAPLISVPASVLRYDDATIVKGTRYCYRVRARNSVGASAYSNEACTP